MTHRAEPTTGKLPVYFAARSPRWFSAVAAMGMIVGFMVVSLACEPRPESLTVPLAYTPTTAPSISFTLPPGAGKIYLMPVDDLRPDKTKLGQNTKQPPPVPILIGTPSAADWVHDTTASIFQQNGLTVVSDAGDADMLITISISELFANENPDYAAYISESIKVQDKNGKDLWDGTVNGDAGYDGGGLKVEHYCQVASDALDDATTKLLANPDFERALVPQASGTDTVLPPAH